MNKSVLIVTPFFAPQSHAAVYRAYKLAKYLPLYGWKPYVLTVDTNYKYNEDPDLLAELPREVEIFKARYFEPTLRGLRMALGGASRTFPALKKTKHMPEYREGGERQGFLKSIYREFLKRWVHVPDDYWTWAGPAIRCGRELIKKNHIPIVLTSYLPYTSLIIGRALQLDGIKWVADFRDPGVYSAKTSSSVERVYAKQRDIEKMAVMRADALTGLSSSYAMILNATYGDELRNPMRFIPTGFDEDLLRHETLSPTGDEPYIVFSGEYMPSYSQEFFEIFASAVSEDTGSARPRTMMLVVGHIILNKARLVPVLEKLKIKDRVKFLDHVSPRELYGLLKRAEACVLAPGEDQFWWTSFAKMVDYIALRKPVLAIVPNPSESRTVLTQTGLGIFLEGDRQERIRTLRDFLQGKLRPVSPHEEECKKYTVQYQTESFVRLFEDLQK